MSESKKPTDENRALHDAFIEPFKHDLTEWRKEFAAKWIATPQDVDDIREFMRQNLPTDKFIINKLESKNGEHDFRAIHGKNGITR